MLRTVTVGLKLTRLGLRFDIRARGGETISSTSAVEDTGLRWLAGRMLNIILLEEVLDRGYGCRSCRDIWITTFDINGESSGIWICRAFSGVDDTYSTVAQNNIVMGFNFRFSRDRLVSRFWCQSPNILPYIGVRGVVRFRF